MLVAFKRRPSELAAYQKKMLVIDDHVGVSFAGLTADATSLGRWMKTECRNARYVSGFPVSPLKFMQSHYRAHLSLIYLLSSIPKINKK